MLVPDKLLIDGRDLIDVSQPNGQAVSDHERKINDIINYLQEQQNAIMSMENLSEAVMAIKRPNPYNCSKYGTHQWELCYANDTAPLQTGKPHRHITNVQFEIPIRMYECPCGAFIGIPKEEHDKV